MSSKFVKQLKRDLKASPAKAGALGVLLVVAVVFWGPLVFKSDKTSPKPRSVATTSSTSTSTATPPSRAAAPAAETQLAWKQLQEFVGRDPRMAPRRPKAAGSASPAELNPFSTKTREERDQEETDALLDEALALGMFDEAGVAQTAVTEGVKLEDCPLVLSSTLVGGKAAKAVINDRSFARGATLGNWHGSPLTLETVEPRRAVVAWNGQSRELKILRPERTQTQSLGLPQPSESPLNGADQAPPSKSDEI